MAPHLEEYRFGADLSIVFFLNYVMCLVSQERSEREIIVPNSSSSPGKIPQTIREVNLPGRIRAAGGANLKEAGEFFGWEPGRVIKSAADFTRDQLLAKGWTKDRLLNVAEGYEHIARITPYNPSAAGRAAQLRELAKLFD